jgi:NADH:ubiquinone oxidoreductase subunit E
MAAGFAMAVSAAILLADYTVASRRAPRDDRVVKSLQERVRSDSSLAPNLAAEQKRVTAARLARKSRDNGLAWGLIAWSAVFLTCAKRQLRSRGRQPAVMDKRTQVAARVSRHARSWPAPQTAAAETLDLTFVDRLVAQEGRGKEAAIVLLQGIQVHYRYLPDEALRRVCELTEITPAQIAGTSSFYGQFRRSPVGKYLVRVCHGTACHVAGARQVTEELRRYLAIPDGADTDAARLFTLESVACLGCCSLAPVLMVDGHTAGRLTPAGACGALEPFERKETA